MNWAEETLSGYRQSDYRIIFNLTGGFKSVQGFLQTLAMFYADEVVYVFQEADTLMRIPRLPIKFAVDDTVVQNLNVFRRLSLGLVAQDLNNVPETMLMSIQEEKTLSPWGSLVWKQSKKKIYQEKLWPSPSLKIHYGENFKNSLSRLSPERLGMINEKIDDLTYCFEMGHNLNSLGFQHLKGNVQHPSTHEFYAWSDQDAKRIYGHYEGERFVLDRLGEHL